MPHHRCLDPQDPYAQREVLVTYRHRPDAGHPHLIRAAAEDYVDILSELTEAQCADLRREIAQALGTLARRARFDGPAATLSRPGR